MEDLCIKCGECWRIKVGSRYEVIALESQCPGQDLVSKRCMVYGWRQTWLARVLTGQRCLSAESAAWEGLLTKRCRNRLEYSLWVDFEEARLAKVKRVTI